MGASSPSGKWVTRPPVAAFGDASSFLPRSAPVRGDHPETADLLGLDPGVGGGGPTSPYFPGFSACLWLHSKAFQGLKARERKTKEGIKSRNVP